MQKFVELINKSFKNRMITDKDLAIAVGHIVGPMQLV